MTLITYPTRVHFADDVLEEALHSELEREGCRLPLLITAHAPAHPELEDRVRAGLPPTVKPQLVTFSPESDQYTIVKDVTASGLMPDVIIAFGAARAIELGRKFRYTYAKKHNTRLSLYAIPGVDGLPGPCTRNLETWRAGLPSVLICDPTVTLAADGMQLRKAAVLSLVRCYESYLAVAYNPPADGMALDGLNRCVNNLPKIDAAADVDLHREVMAANLNAGLSQEKGVGPAIAMAAILAKVPGDTADIAGLILPAVARAQYVNSDKAEALRKVLGQDDLPLDRALDRILTFPNGPQSLAGLGISKTALDDAAAAVGDKFGLNFQSARAALDTIYEKEPAP